MSKSPTIYTCDNCERDLTTTPYMSQNRLELKSVPMGHKPNRAVFATSRSSLYPIPDSHFCGTTCLLRWAQKRVDEIIRDLRIDLGRKRDAFEKADPGSHRIEVEDPHWGHVIYSYEDLEKEVKERLPKLIKEWQ